jgi:hypothetical protein
MMRQFLMQAVADEPAVGDVDLSLPYKLAVVHDTSEQTSEHQPNRHLGIDPRPPVVEAIIVGDFQDRSSTRSMRASTCSSGMSCLSEPEQLQLIPLLTPEHTAPPPIANQRRQRNQALRAF